MFQCIIQQRNGWSRNSPEWREVFPDVRVQLNEQLRCLDGRLETQMSLVQELQDYFRRRAEVELEYSRSLEKLSRTLTLRQREQKCKREQWGLFSASACYHQLAQNTRTTSRDHNVLAEVYSTQIVARLGQVVEDVQRIYKRCRAIGDELHEEILRILHELHTTMKTYHGYQAEMRVAETKLRLAEGQSQKVEQSTPPEKLPRSKKYRLIEKELQKRKNKYNDASLKALKARNEYVLCLEAANNTIHKYFVDDLSDLIDCMDFGFHQCISRALLMHVTAEEGRQRSAQSQNDQLSSCISALDSRLDKQRFLESNHTAFVIPKKFEFQGLRGDEVVNVEAELLPSLRDELTARLHQLQNRIMTLRAESEEVWKTLETAETTLLAMLGAKDYDCSALFSGNADTTPTPATRPPETVAIKLRADRHETEEFYLTKFREYLLGTSRISRLEAKQEHIQHTLQNSMSGNGPASLSLNLIVSSNHNHAPGQPPSNKPVRRKRIGRLQMNGQPKLFCGSLEEYLEMSNQDIPLILKSCIRVINLYGLHHQGIFRVSGAQVEINNFREAFERGEDPLSDTTDASDINSVAGVLKLYLRELREPLFPIVYFEHFMDLAQLESKHEFVVKMRDLIMSLPRPFIVVLRYLFAFLNHLSEFSDENMMDPYNLAICFGPTLVPVPEDKDQVQFQNQVNELIKNIILFNEDIFPPISSIPGPLYEKFISREPDDNDVGDSPSDHAQEDLDSEVYPSEDECDSLEATAQFDFHARSERELSFKQGDHLQLYTQVSNDWWRGRGVQGSEGLIPDKYILLKIKDEDREKIELIKSSSSDESMRRRASSSNDSVLSGASGSTQNDSPLFGNGNSSTWPEIGGLTSRSPALTTCEPPPPPLLSPTAEAALGTAHKSVSCSSLDSGKESASDDQLQRADTVDSSEPPADYDAAGDIHQNLSPLSPDSGASGSSESPPTEAAAVLPSARRNEEKATDQLLASAVLCAEQSVAKEPSDDHARKQHVKSHSMSEPTSEQAVSVHRRANSTDSADQLWELRQKQTPDLVLDLPRRIPVEPPKEEPEEPTSVGPESPDMTTTAERFAKQNQCTLKKNTKAGSSSKSTEEAAKATPEDISATERSSSVATESAGAQGATNARRPPIAVKPPLKAKPQIMKKPVLPTQIMKEEEIVSSKKGPDQCDNNK